MKKQVIRCPCCDKQIRLFISKGEVEIDNDFLNKDKESISKLLSEGKIEFGELRGKYE